MMIFSAAPFLGPVLGPLIAGFINQNTNWHWTFYVPETFDPQLLRLRAIR
jgi:MFS family permease